MAKRASGQGGARKKTASRRATTSTRPAGRGARASQMLLPPPPGRIGEYAEELGRMLGQLRARVDDIAGERQQLINQLSTVVGDAQTLLADLGHRAQRSMQQLTGVGRNRKRAAAGRMPKGMAGGLDRKTHTLPASARRKLEKSKRG